MASIATVVTRGYGSFGSASLVVTRGYGIGEQVAPPITSRRFYIPGRPDVAGQLRGAAPGQVDNRLGIPSVADSRRARDDDQVQP